MSVSNARWERIEKMYTCVCGGYCANISDRPTCTSCGFQKPFTIFVPERDPMAWSKRKSVHRRDRWFSKRMIGVVRSSDKEILRADFIKVLSVLVSKKLIRRNVSRYSYYIIRLSSRRGFPLLEDVKDMRDGHVRHMFDDRLFGAVYKELGWDADCKCPMFLSWKDT